MLRRFCILKEGGGVSLFRLNKYILSPCHSRFQVIWTFHNVVYRDAKEMYTTCRVFVFLIKNPIGS